MPNREFLETYPLYRKFTMKVPSTVDKLPKPAIHMDCLVCKSAQTFNVLHEYHRTSGLEYANDATQGEVLRIVYACTSCGDFGRYFFVKLDSEYVMKVGQEPPWDISVDRALQQLLGKRVSYYKKGLICESQTYGIGAFGYYRRIVEEIIDELLEHVPDVMTGEDRQKYLEGLELVKQTKVTEEKIQLVKDLLPPILRPEGLNPLSILHDVLSEGLHAESDDRCIELAMQVREVLVFLVNQIEQSKVAGKNFTENMRRLLDRKRKTAA